MSDFNSRGSRVLFVFSNVKFIGQISDSWTFLKFVLDFFLLVDSSVFRTEPLELFVIKRNCY